MDAAILRTLAKIRKKEGVYGTDKILETELAAAQAAAGERGLGARSAQKSEKPFLLKDLHRQNLLDGVDSDHEDEEPLTNVEAARRAAHDARAAFAAFGDSDDEEVLTKREKDDGEDEAEDAAYRQFLLEMGGGEAEVRAALGMAEAPTTDFREYKEETPKKKEKEKEMSEEKRGKREAKRKVKRAQADEDFLME